MLLGIPKRKRPVISCGECHRRKQKPCAHCIKRGVQDACRYEPDDDRTSYDIRPPTSRRKDSLTQPSTAATPTTPTSTLSEELKQLGYTSSITGTAGLISNLGQLGTKQQQKLPIDSTATPYVSIIRQLPSQKCTNILVQSFFQNVAWQYDIVDETIFNRQLTQWNSLSYAQLRLAPDSLPVNLQSFPSLLFQVLAQALLFQPLVYDKSLDGLKYIPNMELSDRAEDFSNAGQELAACFRRRELTLNMVQAQLMRACFEKTTGAVVDAWHTLGTAIRNAQELGLHLLGPEEMASTTVPASERDLGRKLWLMLHIWDNHMAIVLGRPLFTRMNPNDVPSPMSWSHSPASSPSMPKVPQPRDVILCGYHTAYRFLQDIRDLEQRKIEDCRALIQGIHEKIATNITNLPAWAAAQRSRDGEPAWLAAALETMLTNVHFVLFALHRPFVFKEQSSRERAFYSAMQILESQTRLFNLMQDLQYHSFNLVFSTFDAMVLIAALQIRFPDEFIEQLPATKQNLEWGLNRLNVLQARNNLAGPAYSTIERLCRKLSVVAFPTQHMRQVDGTPASLTSTTLVGAENEMSPVNWDGFTHFAFGSISAPPVDDILINDGILGAYPEHHQGAFNNLTQLPLGFFDTMENGKPGE
ncbi:hypothetical protein VHEMI07047 [[Torrubiella] hemipterigena]|uniref:Xylanolytic transcriptional activator regulatory domain-containing protein n=1 Tax=[Torrubiella] hemipterigena TaxID=1531966 RepID=A0A0A1TM67_9HYPO|nr:hypothetical protein VHEMI07047 [[Torrubiella] hemipterigena]